MGFDPSSTLDPRTRNIDMRRRHRDRQFMIRTESQFIDLIRPAIDFNDDGIVSRVGSYVDLAISGGLARGSLARAVLDAFPGNQLAEHVAEVILL
jgi:hypothetical protein